VLSISRLTDTALASAVYASREALPLPCKTCFRLAGCAFSGRVSNPLDHDRRFLVTFPSSFSGLCLTLKRIPVILKHSLRERNSWRIRLGLVVG
jgi:hypothetical protein